MAYDPQKRDLPTLQADFDRDTEDACSDLQYGTCLLYTSPSPRDS